MARTLRSRDGRVCIRSNTVSASRDVFLLVDCLALGAGNHVQPSRNASCRLVGLRELTVQSESSRRYWSNSVALSLHSAIQPTAQPTQRGTNTAAS